MTAPIAAKPPPSVARELINNAFAGTPGRIRLFGAIAVGVCLIFGALTFAFVLRVNDSLGAERTHAAQFVRIQTIRTSLVQADADATNAFLVGGLPSSDVLNSYTDGINTATKTLADASSADQTDAQSLEKVNEQIASYTGLIEDARANNRQGFPIGAAYLRAASTSLREQSLPLLRQIGDRERARVNHGSNTTGQTLAALWIILAIALIGLLVAQFWLSRRTHRLFNLPLVAATTLVLLGGLVGVAVVGWSHQQESEARSGPYTDTVNLATARVDGFDAKSAESLALISRSSGDALEAQIQKDISEARQATTDPEVSNAIEVYASAHGDVHDANVKQGNYHAAVQLATGTGKANVAFNAFDATSGAALDSSSSSLASKLHDARSPLFAISWLLLAIGVLAAIVARRGIAQRLREYR